MRGKSVTAASFRYSDHITSWSLKNKLKSALQARTGTPMPPSDLLIDRFYA
jgi:hypothetical protein